MTQQSFFYRYHHFSGVWLVFALFAAALLAGCAPTPVSADTPSFATVTTYSASDATHLALLTFQPQQDTSASVTGSWTTWSAGFSQDITDVSPPQATRFPFSGQMQDRQSQQTIITLNVDGSVLTATVHTKDLSLNGTFAQTDFQPTTWVTLSTTAANQLLNAFQQAIVTRKHLIALQSLLDQTPPPQDSDPLTYAFIVQEAQSYIQRLQQEHDQVLSSDHPCGTHALALFHVQYPPDESLFNLSSAEVAQNTPVQNAQLITNASSLGVALQGLQTAWQTMQHTPVSQVARLSSSWQASHSEETQAVQQAQKRLGTLQQFVVTDAQTLTDLKQQSQQLARDVQNMTAQQGCV